MDNTTLKLVLASTAAAALSSGVATADNHDIKEITDDAKVKCIGGNECAGEGQCATATHACAGQNSCKGTGWVYMPKSECEKIPGATVEEK